MLQAGRQAALRALTEFAGPPAQGQQNYSVAQLSAVGSRNITLQDRHSMCSAFEIARKQTVPVDFALLFLDRSDSVTYAYFKDLADRVFGYHSICITRRCIGNAQGEKFSNIMLKMNLKAAGTNHTTSGGQISALMGNTLVLGADVTHPGTGSVPGCPSIAAIVGSVDGNAGRFLGSMRLQNQTRKEVRRHFITFEPF
jgi:eukaryotic translation initiation factor 2C